MNEIQLTYSPYTLKLKVPFATSKVIVTERKGFVISLISNSGMIGTGDAAPFPEFGSETYEEDEKFLDRLSLPLKIDLNDTTKSINDNLSSLDSLPALRHGIEQALLSLICNEKKISLNSLVNKTSNTIIAVNGAIGFSPVEKSVEKAAELIRQGFRTLKIKVGRDDFGEDYSVIESVRKHLKGSFNLRIDANGKWSPDDAANYLQQLEKFNIEYAEQPVNNLKDFIQLKQKTIIPLAPDESIRSVEDAKSFIEYKAADYLILKPMMIGGLLPALDIIEMASQNNVRAVITSSFESAIGRSYAVFIASLIDSITAHGLSTGSYIENDIANDPFPVTNGAIYLQK